LLGCVVYGRVAGDTASNYLFQKALKGSSSSAAQRLGQISLHIDPSQPGKISVEWGSQSSSGTGSKQAQQSQTSAGPVMKDGADSSDPGKVSKPNNPAKFSIPEKEFTMEEVAKHNKKENIWVVVKGVVMDLSNWLEEHPGGVQALMNFAGRDATEEFAMLHEDSVIPKYAPSQVIGRVKGQTPSLEI
jgi:cytochrome b involved in lipid metabolism